jgi:hypothetical protein
MMVSEEIMREVNSGTWSRKHRKMLTRWAEKVAHVEWTFELIAQQIEGVKEER